MRNEIVESVRCRDDKEGLANGIIQEGKREWDEWIEKKQELGRRNFKE